MKRTTDATVAVELQQTLRYTDVRNFRTLVQAAFLAKQKTLGKQTLSSGTPELLSPPLIEKPLELE